MVTSDESEIMGNVEYCHETPEKPTVYIVVASMNRSDEILGVFSDPVVATRFASRHTGDLGVFVEEHVLDCPKQDSDMYVAP